MNLQILGDIESSLNPSLSVVKDWTDKTNAQSFSSVHTVPVTQAVGPVLLPIQEDNLRNEGHETHHPIPPHCW